MSYHSTNLTFVRVRLLTGAFFLFVILRIVFAICRLCVVHASLLRVILIKYDDDDDNDDDDNY